MGSAGGFSSTEPYVHSDTNVAPGNDYQTIDPRCVQALIETCPWLAGSIVDPCAAHRQWDRR